MESFYHVNLTMRMIILVKICKWCFLWPVSVENHGNKYTIKNSVPWTVASVIVVLILVVWFNAYFCLSMIGFSYEMSLKFLPYFVDMLLLCSLCYGILGTSWDRTKKLVKYVKSLEEANVTVDDIVSRKIYRQAIAAFFLDALIIMCRTVTLSSSRVVTLPIKIQYVDFPLYTLSVVWAAYKIILYYLMAQLGAVFQNVISVTQKDIARSVSQKDQLLAIEVAMNRQQVLRDATAYFMEGFNLPAALGIVLQTFRMILNLYVLVPVIVNSDAGIRALLTFLYAMWHQSMYFYFINTCHNVKLHDFKMKHMISEALIRLVNPKCSSDLKRPIKYLCYRLDYIRSNDLSLKPFGFVEIDRTLYPKTLSMVAFYLVILIQVNKG